MLNYLNLIPELNGNIDVNGNNGGPFEIIFQNALAGQAVSTIVSTDRRMLRSPSSRPRAALIPLAL